MASTHKPPLEWYLLPPSRNHQSRLASAPDAGVLYQLCLATYTSPELLGKAWKVKVPGSSYWYICNSLDEAKQWAEEHWQHGMWNQFQGVWGPEAPNE